MVNHFALPDAESKKVIQLVKSGFRQCGKTLMTSVDWTTTKYALQQKINGIEQFILRLRLLCTTERL
jgi:hypothetical protein